MTVTAQIIADSISEAGIRITTFELDYPRIVHAELMTHREFSRNAASSRAIPTKAVLERVMNDPAMPVHFGKNQTGMQDAGEHFELINGYTPQEWWKLMALSAAKFSEGFADAGYHKQVANRGTEFAQNIKVVVTSTSYDNWFWLRFCEMADPTINVLSNVMLAAYNDSSPRLLLPGEWHVPYYFDGYWSWNGVSVDIAEQMVDVHGHTLAEALKISSSCSAQVSYRKCDDTLEKAVGLYDRLVGAEKVHASPFEHQGTPIENPRLGDAPYAHLTEWQEGVTHLDRNGVFHSGNFTGWIQHRQLIPNHVATSFNYLQE
ncbi:Thymidylate synthase ThyX [compost metagenome]